MKRLGIVQSVLIVVVLAIAINAGPEPPLITVDYPLNGSIFPPEITPPTFLWRDPAKADSWRIEAAFHDGSTALRVNSAGERLQIGEIDERCIAPTNELPKLSPKQAEAH